MSALPHSDGIHQVPKEHKNSSEPKKKALLTHKEKKAAKKAKKDSKGFLGTAS